jgi:hypothetical protein
LRRDPDHGGYKFWLNNLAGKNAGDPVRYAPIICAFLNSSEYQSRFGMQPTHHEGECQQPVTKE